MAALVAGIRERVSARRGNRAAAVRPCEYTTETIRPDGHGERQAVPQWKLKIENVKCKIAEFHFSRREVFMTFVLLYDVSTIRSNHSAILHSTFSTLNLYVCSAFPPFVVADAIRRHCIGIRIIGSDRFQPESKLRMENGECRIVDLLGSCQRRKVP